MDTDTKRDIDVPQSYVEDDKQRMMNVLTRPFPNLAVRQRAGGGGKQLDYLEGHTVINRILEANPEWSWIIERHDILEFDKVDKSGNVTGRDYVVFVIGTLDIPGLGPRQGVGVQKLVVGANGIQEDMLKGADTDAFKAASKKFGVGIELYGENYERKDAKNALARYMNNQPQMKTTMASWVRERLQGQTLDEQTPGNLRRILADLKAEFPEMDEEAAARRVIKDE